MWPKYAGWRDGVAKEVSPEAARDWLVKLDEDGRGPFWFDGLPDNPDGSMDYGCAAQVLDWLAREVENGTMCGTVAIGLHDDGQVTFEWLEEVDR